MDLVVHFQPLPDDLDSAELDFLARKGAFRIPRTPLLHQLLQAFIQFSHGYVPVLDLKSFLGVLMNGGPHPSSSLLLFQCVLLAGTSFVDMKYLEAEGYKSREEAHKHFFHKARVLLTLLSTRHGRQHCWLLDC